MSGMRSKDAPMDFEFTSDRANTVSAWAAPSDPFTTPRKRNRDENVHMTPVLMTPRFGAIPNGTPFLMQQHVPAEPEVRDVDMTEVSPSKPEEVTHEVNGRTISLGAVKRVSKSRQKLRGTRSTLRIKEEEGSQDESESDDEPDRVALRTQNTSNHYTLNMPSAPAPQSDTPYILLGYLQFFFNLSLISLFLYLVVQFIFTVQRDVEHRISEYSMDIVQEIALCSMQFNENCQIGKTVPAMAHQCGLWETCMNRDPTLVGRAKVGAELIAEVVNGFVEPISWKALIFTLTSLSFLTVFINALLSLYRSRHHHPPPAPPAGLQHQNSFPGPPYPSHQFAGYLSPAPTPSWGRNWVPPNDEDIQTPTRRRRLEGGLTAKIK